MKIKYLPLLSLIFLTSCSNGPQIINDKYTGQSTAVSTTVTAYSGMFSWLKVRAFYSTHNGYGLNTVYSNYGWIFPETVWSDGKQYPYNNYSSDTAMCGGAGGCITLEKGIIKLTKEDFEKFSVEGFDFKLIGSKDSVIGKVPPSIFREVINEVTNK